MCGITGAFAFIRPSDLHGIEPMTDALIHRGPDSGGYYRQSHISLGHRRLCVLDLSDAANQPFSDLTNRYTIAFNGEIYNHQEIRHKLSNHNFRTSGDTEVILAAYSEWDTDCLAHLKGMFAFAIWDNRENRLFVARDRLGVKPLYYYHDEKILAFSSEIRSLLENKHVPKKLDLNAVARFLTTQSFAGPSTVIQSIKQLDAGSYMVVDEKGLQQKKYWDIPSTFNPGLDYSSSKVVLKKVRDLMYAAVERRMISDVPIGAFLSGGIDSSAVVGIMKDVKGVGPNTFSIGFNEKDYDESEYAEAIARRFRTVHTRISLRPDYFLEELVNALNSMDTPTGDGVNTYVVSKKVRESGLIVALSGIGGDELFCGYPIFTRFHSINRSSLAWNRTKGLRRLAAGILPDNRLKRFMTIPDSTIQSVYPFFREIISVQRIARLTHIPIPVASQIFELPESIRQFPLLSQVSIAEYLNYTQNTLLKDTDQMSMAVSLEVREPFFDHELIEYVLNVPDKIKYPHYPKQLLVESLEGLLPKEIIHRKKQGFLFPWNLWMKRELRGFCDDHIKRMAERDFINAPELLKFWNRFLKGDTTIRWMEIWLFVILEYWMEKNGIE